MDFFDTVETTSLSGRETREVIDFLAESTPTDASRSTPSEWDDEVSGLIGELLSAGG